MQEVSEKPLRAPAISGSEKDVRGRVGVLLLNLGTPDATDYWSMRRYLKQFLSDRRVIEEPAWKWWPILNLIILTVRPGRKGRDYATIWNNERNESPFKTITRSQAEKLAAALADHPEVVVDFAMRYANPSTASGIDALFAAGCDRILLVPLYPQFADKLAFEPETILATFHGMPQKYVDAGDPYYGQCLTTSRLVREALGVGEERWITSFQSRFGNDPWLQPYTDKTVERLARSGIKRLALVAPGFAADCLETLEELDVENRRIFMKNGGEQFAYIPALNDSDDGMRVIEAVVRRELSGWL
jgi:ferrochelatase